jgi:N-acetylmuramoyl-L-alanine amidase
MAAGCDLFVSLHCNAAGSQEAHGSEVWIIVNASEPSQALAAQVGAALASVTGEDRGIKRQNFTVISVAESIGVPAILAEMEFISNPDGELSLINRQMEYAAAIAGAILRFGQEG